MAEEAKIFSQPVRLDRKMEELWSAWQEQANSLIRHDNNNIMVFACVNA
jgi:hypothetical protein